MGISLRIFVLIAALVSSAFAVNVTVSSPANYATVGSSVTIYAGASSSYPITGWRIYVDGNSVYSAGTTQSIAAPISMGGGTHQVVVRAWDSTGAYGSNNLQLTVGSASTTGSSIGAGISVNVSSPANGATVASSTTIYASASSGYPVTGWRIYIDGRESWGAGATTSISAPISMGTGSHQVIVRAWNTTGAYGDRTLTLNVGSSTSTSSGSGVPVPPSNAAVFSRIEEMGGWGNCATYGCSGSSNPVSYWMAPYQSSPSLDSASTQFYVSGSAWSDVLWWKNLTPVDWATHFLLDYWVKPNADTLTHAEALEFDFVQAVNGRKWDISNQCHYSGQHWDTWDGLNLTWVHTTVPCPKMDPNAWHHIQIAAERVNGQTHNISYTVDGVTYQVPTEYAWHGTRTTTWPNMLNVQVQLDINVNPGTVSEYIDKMTLYAW